FKLSNRSDPRVTGVGRVLRASSLDELPQLFNVLAGQMSLVGPRPVVPAELSLYGQHDAAYLALRPGVTGLWQVSGRNVIRFPQRAEMDADYGRRCSPSLDLRILVSTPLAVFTRRGVK
ncbi:MAG: sugar transferase, partial [Acidimicrobiales bacterium]